MDGELKSGTPGNLFRNIPGTPLNERFKLGKGGELEYRVDIDGIGPKQVGGHLTAKKL